MKTYHFPFLKPVLVSNRTPDRGILSNLLYELNLDKTLINYEYYTYKMFTWDIIEVASYDYYFVTNRMKEILDKKYIPNVTFYKIKLFYEFYDTKRVDIEAEGEYFLMYVKPYSIKDISIDYSKSLFTTQLWSELQIKGKPAKIDQPIKNEEELISTMGNIQLQKISTDHLHASSVSKLSDIFSFKDNMDKSIGIDERLKFCFSGYAVFSDEIIKEFKAQKLKGIVSHKPVFYLE